MRPPEIAAEIIKAKLDRKLDRVYDLAELANADEQLCQEVANAMEAIVLTLPWPDMRRAFHAFWRLNPSPAASALRSIEQKLFPPAMLRLIGEQRDSGEPEQELRTLLMLWGTLRRFDGPAAKQIVLTAREYVPGPWPFERLNAYFYSSG